MPGYFCQRTHFCDCCRNMGPFLCGVKGANRFMTVHLHCLVNNLRRISKMSTLPPLEKFLRTPMAWILRTSWCVVGGRRSARTMQRNFINQSETNEQRGFPNIPHRTMAYSGFYEEIWNRFVSCEQDMSTIGIGDCPLAMKWNITKQLCVCVAVHELLTTLLALEMAEQEILEHAPSTQYKLFHIIPQVLFRQSRDVLAS